MKKLRQSCGAKALLHPLGCDTVEGMTPERKSAALPLLAGLILTLPVTLYVVGYFWLAECHNLEARDDVIAIVRLYDHPGLVAAFKPGGWVESKARGVPILIRLRHA
jgi:hypothetical protein